MRPDDSNDPGRLDRQKLAAVHRIVEDNDIPTWPRPSAPVMVAERFLAERYQPERYQPDDGTDVFTLRSWRGSWIKWDEGVWRVAEDSEIQAELYAALKGVTYLGGKPWNPTRRKISDVVHAMSAITRLSETVDPGDWIGDDPEKAPARRQVLISVKNGTLLIPQRTLIPHDPGLFNLVQGPFDYDPEATAAPRWDQFLEELWPNDLDSVRAFQEWFGYVISGRTHLHKMLLLVGPPRSGKSVSAGVLAALVGRGNVASPSLATLVTNFGLQPLIGKSLAIIPDARLGGRGSAQIVERLLTLSGEDLVTADRKYKEPWEGKMTTRFLIVSNEIPRFGDASQAIAKRFIILTIREDVLGNEDTGLPGKLEAELGGIFAWALDGLDRLTAAGTFAQPAASLEAVRTMEDLASPEAAFVHESCTLGHQHTIPCAALFAAWKEWCDATENRPGTVAVFGRNLSAAFPMLRRARASDGHRRPWIYEGIALDTDASATRDDAPTEAAAVLRDVLSGRVIEGSD